MKSLIVTLALIAGAIWAGTSYFAGAQSKSGYEQFLSQTTAIKPFAFEKESFEQGLTTSRAVTVVKESSAPGAEILLRLAHDINHSSVQLDDNSPSIGTATIRTTLVDGSINSKYDTIKNIFSVDEPIEITTRAGVSGHIASEIKVNTLTFSLGGSETAIVEETRFTLTNNNSRIVGDGVLGATTLTAADGSSTAISPSIVSFDLANEQIQTSDYQVLVKTPELTAQTPYQNTPITATGLQLGINADVDGEQIDYSAFIDIDALDIGSTPTTDTAPVTSGTLEIAGNNFNIQAIRDFHDFLETQSASGQKTLIQKLTGDGPVKFSEAYLQKFAELATKNIELGFNLDLNNAAGNAHAKFNLVFIGDQSETGRDMLVSVGDLVNAIKIEADLVADKAALALTPDIDVMQSPSAQFVFEDQGDQWVSKLETSGLSADLNGEIYPFFELFGGVLEIPFKMWLEIQEY